MNNQTAKRAALLKFNAKDRLAKQTWHELTRIANAARFAHNQATPADIEFVDAVEAAMTNTTGTISVTYKAPTLAHLFAR